MRGPRGVAVAVALAGALAFAVCAALLVPWDPVPGGPVRPVAPGSVLTAAEIDRAEEYASLARVWSWCSLLVSLGLACLLGFTRHGAAAVGRLRGPWWWRVVLSVALLALAGRVVTLPFSVLLRRRRLEFGLTEQGWGAYAVDLAKGEAIQVAMTSIGVLLVVAAARRWRRAWPAVAGLLLAGTVVLGSFAYPLVVEPLFNRFTSLPDGPLRSSILEIAEREGVRVDDVLVADASRRTTTLNAYVSGFGSSRRVVVYDNLVDEASGLDDRQTLSVVAHELSHARHDDVVTGTLLGASGALVAVGLLALVAGRVSDPRQVPRLLALLAVASLAASPVQNGISRLVESRADVDALRATGDPEAFVAVQTELARRSLSDPTPPEWAQFWFGSHPTTLERVAIAVRVGEPVSSSRPRSAAQLQVPTLVSSRMSLQLPWKSPLAPPPNKKTAATIRAAIPATSRPYSTADAPRSVRGLTRGETTTRPSL